MSTVGWLPAPAEELFGADATAEESYDVLTVDVPPSSWLTALETARTTLSCTYFDWLSAVDEPGTGFRVSAHLVALGPVRRLLVRTTVPHETATLPSAVGIYAGAAWHERETHEMFGVVFENHPGLEHLLLPENFEGHPLRKDFVLAARVAKAWPGAKEPGESAAGAAHGGPKRRQMLPPGVPDPNEWGPLKGQLPPAPARAAGRAAGERPARAAGERPVRRTRTAAEGSAGQTEAATAQAGPAEAAGTGPAPARPETTGAPAARPRRTRSASEGSASQTTPKRPSSGAEGEAAPRAAAEGPPAEASVAREPAPAPARPRRARSASQGSASQRPQPEDAAQTPEPAEPTQARSADPASAEPASAGPASTEPEGTQPDGTARRSRAPRTSDAPWHHARPAFDEREPEAEPEQRSGTSEDPAASRETADPDPDSAPGAPDQPEQPDHPTGGP
ncbi:NADH-quinone oxidoreductase subunit C [Streptomyces sp. NPDC048362]|uniref:NADH-quinone oxidoreductase subunit C n=1 Tax=Streptomyces sp. NPDC048362 TaxID=3365539 RepID=UPI00372361A5